MATLERSLIRRQEGNVARALHALGRLCARRSLLVIGVWVAAAIAIGLAVARFGAETSNDLSLPGTGSQEVSDLLEERFPPQQNGTSPIVFDVTTGKLTDATNKQAIKESVQAIRNAPHVYSVTNPVSSDGQTAGLLSKDGQTAFAPVLLDIGSGELDEEIAQRVFDATEPAQRAGIRVAAEGSIGSELSDQPTETSELVGIAAAMVILTLVLGSLVAMGLPILTAVVGLGVALAAVGLLGHLIATPDTAATLATMIGLGVGIDYSLFLITRHQDQLRTGVEMEESIARAVATSGSAIVFAGGTVVIALVSLRVSQIPLLSSLGLASAVAVLTAVVAAISLLPALLGLLKHRIHWLSLPGFMRSKHRARGGMWGRWAGFVARHPILIIVGALAFLIPLMFPATSLNFGQEDIGAASKSTTERQAYDMISAGFGAGYNGPLEVASSLSPPAQPSSEYTNKYDEATSLQKDLEQKQKELPKQQAQLESEQQQLERDQRQLENQERQLEAQEASLETQRNALTQREAVLRRQAAELQTEQRQLEAAGRQLQAQRRELQTDKRQLQSEQMRLEAQQAQLEARETELRNEARALARAARPLLRRLARIELRERILERRIARLDDDPIRQERLQARLAQLQEEEQEVRRALAPLERQAQRLAAQARTLETQAKQLQRQADQLQRQADQLKAEGNRLQAEGNQLRVQARQLQAEGAQLERQKASLEREAAALQQEGDQLQAEATALRQQANDLQRQANNLQQQADQLKAEQQQAEQEEKQAKKLQKQLTAMLTQAGGDPRGTDPRIVRLQDALSGTDGVLALTPPQLNKKGDVVLLSAVPTTAPATVSTANLVGTVRDDVLPKVHDQGGITSYVGGYTASYVDLATLISNRLLLVIGTVILLGFVLLMIAFRSLLVPLQAAVTNLLSAAAAFGVLTATFQWGWGTSLVGLDTTTPDVPIASYVPLMMFAVLFGLSMDYEVFLVSHIQQHHMEGEPEREAVASGLTSSARITTAAALIMASVFASFILNGDPTIKQFGVGLSVAVLLAGALVVTLAPAALSVMGEAAWWLPRWLDRLLPHISVEGEGAVAGGREKAPSHPQGAPVPWTTSAEERPTGSAGVGGITFREDE